MSGRDEFVQIAGTVPFDNDTNGFISDDVQSAIEELATTTAVSASPGYTWGRSGNTSSGTWLLNDTVPSNVTGRNFSLYNGELIQVSASNEDTTTAVLGIYQHDHTTYTQIATITLSSQIRSVQTYTGVSVTQNLELAIKVESGSVKNPVVQLLLKGTSTP